MKLITTRLMIQNITKRWYFQYSNQGGMQQTIMFGKATAQEIYDKLLQLDGDTATKEDVKNIIGNYSWTRIECHECGKDAEVVIQLGQEPDYDSATACICTTCLKKALAMV